MSERQRWLVRLEYHLAEDERLSPGDGRVAMLDAWLAAAYDGTATPTPQGWVAEVKIAAGPEIHFIDEARDYGVRLIEECVRELELPAGAITSMGVEDLETLAAGPDIFGSRELAHLLGVSRQRLLQLRGSGVVPAPDVELAATPVWRRATVERLLWAWCRRPGPRPQVS